MSRPVSRSDGRRSRDATPLLTATLLTLTLLVFVPAHVYLANRSDVLVFFSDVIIVTTILAAGTGLVLAGLLAILPAALQQRIVVLILGVSFLLWFHAYCLVWPYGALDGSAIPWASYTGRNIVDALLWLLVLAPLLWFAPRVYPRAGSACLGLLVIQLASLGISAARTYDSPLDFFKHYYVEKEHAFELSKGKNVIVVVLDGFQSDIFSEAVLPNAAYRSHFTGFSYFPDTVAGFNFTEFAVPAILTGNIYDNSVPRDVFLRQAFLGDSLPATLKQAGFAVHLYPWRGFANESIYYHEAVASNFKRRPRPWMNKLVDVVHLVDLGVFRSMPQFAKRYVYNDSKWRLSAVLTDTLARQLLHAAPVGVGEPAKPAEIGPGGVLDNIFFRFIGHDPSRTGPITLGSERGVFKFYHLAGLHVPVKLKRDFTKGVFDYTRANYSEQAEAYAMIMGAFLDELKRLNVYDNSMIVILGDHGSGRAAELYTNPGDSPRIAELDRTAAYGDFQRDKARGIPLLLVKRFGEKGALKTSRAPASLVDIPATVLAELNIPHPRVPAVADHTDFHGVSLFALRPNQPRVRYYGAMQWTLEKSDYANPITLYRIQGFSWSDDSWSLEKILDPKK
ncbi:MAG: sulfatase-like hydrolase/transferase [Opitutae bacterium]|nr:sulfatase-like hydrolase/transferase [Opitutae bacterium]